MAICKKKNSFELFDSYFHISLCVCNLSSSPLSINLFPFSKLLFNYCSVTFVLLIFFPFRLLYITLAIQSVFWGLGHLKLLVSLYQSNILAEDLSVSLNLNHVSKVKLVYLIVIGVDFFYTDSSFAFKVLSRDSRILFFHHCGLFFFFCEHK